MRFGLDDIKMAIQDEASTSVGADIAELGQEESEAPIEEIKPEAAEEEEEAEGEEPEPEPEEGEEKEEEAKDLHPFDRPSIKQINEVFPDLFKKFPSLREMYFREAEYSRVFPTIDDAKEAFSNAESFNTLRADVFDGSGTKFFNAIREVDEKALNKFSGSVLSTLFKVSPDAFWRAANPLIEDVSRNMFNKGVKEKSEDLQNAAKLLSEYFFGNTDIAEGKKTSIPKEESSEVSEERKKFDSERHTVFRTSVETDVRAQVVRMITAIDSRTGKSRLDPDDVFSKFIKDTIVDHVVTDLGAQLSADKDHLKFMDSLWEKAKRNGRTDADKARIISAYLARAKSLIPTLRSKYVSEAMGHNVRRSAKSKEISERVESRRDSSVGRGSGARRENYDPKSINYSKTSDSDILNDNITYK